MGLLMPDTNSADWVEKSWKSFKVSERKKLLKGLGYNTSWARISSIREMVNRGGGMIARDLHRVIKIFKQRNPNVSVKLRGL